MATLREMLVKIYQPNQGIIEFGPGGQSTQDGNNTMAVLGGTPGQSDGAQQGGGSINMPAFRYAGADGGGSGGGGGGLDLSGIDWNDPQQAEMARRWLEREGGQGGEGLGSENEWGGLAGYVDPTLPEMVGRFAPFPLDMVGKLGAAGMRASNASTFDDALDRLGLEGLGFFDQIGAAIGTNDYGTGDLRGYLSEIDRQVRERRAAGGNLDQFDAFNAGLEGPMSPGGVGSFAAARAQSRVGPLDFSGSVSGAGGTGGAYGAAGAAGTGRSSYRDTSPGRRGARDRGGDRGGDQGHGGGGDLGGDRADRAGGPRHQGGPVYGMPGEEVNHDLLAGEYVMSPEAVDMVGPQTFERMNSLARMMGQQHYPAR
jgi:hypothetical protein